MADKGRLTDRESARNRAQKHFTASEQRDVAVKNIIDSERAATGVKTAKLRALRLAKEEADRVATADTSLVEATKSRARKSRAVKAAN